MTQMWIGVDLFDLCDQHLPGDWCKDCTHR